MKVVTTHQMREIDRVTIEKAGVPGLDLMERAGQGVVAAIEGIRIDLEGSRCAIFCGKGNNGGDGFVVARLLTQRGCQVETFLLANMEEVRGDARTNLDRALHLGLKVQEVTRIGQIPVPLKTDVIVDAIFGTGITGPVRELPAEVIDLINCSEAAVVAVDVPSGLNTDSGAVEGPCVRAQVTATMAFPKTGLLLYPGKAYAGRIEVVDIGVPPRVIEEAKVMTELLEQRDIASLLPRRAPNAYKGDCGRVAVMAGSVGMTGAAALCCQSALRSGAGMTILGIPSSLNAIMEVKLTETMTKPLAETDQQTVSLKAEAEIDSLLEWGDVAALGPGLSPNAETGELVRRLVRRIEKPVVIDADGLNALAGHLDDLRACPADVVLTPHVGELSRLTGQSLADIEKARLDAARRAAVDLGVVLVLKGAPTVIADPAGYLFINPTGNAGMATAGCGDVLTGTIAGLLAQGLKTLDAAKAGVFLHGLAGDLAAGEKGQWGLIASDIIEALPEAFLAVSGAG